MNAQIIGATKGHLTSQSLASNPQYVVLDARNGVATGWEEDGGYAFDHEWL